MKEKTSNIVLLIVHQKKSVAGHIGALLAERGYNLERCCPCTGDTLPVNLDSYAAVVVFGGPMSANDCSIEGIRQELNFIPKVLKAEIPFLGLCLGGQMLARVLGAEVTPHKKGHIERQAQAQQQPHGQVSQARGWADTRSRSRRGEKRARTPKTW
jgi:GMP synthase (glutamine-hydrolysing)